MQKTYAATMATNGVNGSHANGVAAPAINGHGSSYAAKHNLAPHFIGGNHLQAASASRVKDFVAAHDGHSVITKVLFSDEKLAVGA